MKTAYLDYNATTPVAKEVSETIVKTLTEAWGNPSSPYEPGVKAKAAIELARKQIARLIKAPEASIVFTSGGTEGNNFVIHSAVQFYLKSVVQDSCVSKGIGDHKPHVITTNIEHDSVIKPLEHMLSQALISLTILPVCKETRCVDVETVLENIRAETCLITIMMANNETGVIQPITTLGKRISWVNRTRRIPVLFHTDAAQTIGKIEVSVQELGVHYLTIVGHKFYGSRIGAVYAKSLKDKPPLLSPLLFGGGQERGLRPGTENTAMIAGLGKAAELVVEHIDEYKKHMVKMRSYLEGKLDETFGSMIEFNTDRKNESSLPNTISVTFLYENVTGAKILTLCPRVFASTGAACHSVEKPSAVLMNSGLDEFSAERTLRLSVGRETTKSDIDFCVDQLKLAITELNSRIRLE